MSERGWFENEETFNRVAALEHTVRELTAMLKLLIARAEQELSDEAKAKAGAREIPVTFAGSHPLPPQKLNFDTAPIKRKKHREKK